MDDDVSEKAIEKEENELEKPLEKMTLRDVRVKFGRKSDEFRAESGAVTRNQRQALQSLQG